MVLIVNRTSHFLDLVRRGTCISGIPWIRTPGPARHHGIPFFWVGSGRGRNSPGPPEGGGRISHGSSGHAELVYSFLFRGEREMGLNRGRLRGGRGRGRDFAEAPEGGVRISADFPGPPEGGGRIRIGRRPLPLPPPRKTGCFPGPGVPDRVF